MQLSNHSMLLQNLLLEANMKNAFCMLYCGGCGIGAADTNVTCIGRKHFVASNLVPCPIDGQ